ncbi:hypothetical protein RND81_12G036500 [Saponaria officinalis]|uniref:Dilute domain-containing protein n=1 Tax=Saponaria officinalis TaxID=3572 RepID=A0AAW1H2U3_SAPOF
MKATMRESEKKKVQNNSQTIIRPVRTPRKESQSTGEEHSRRSLKANEIHSRASRFRPASLRLENDARVRRDSADVYENVAVHYVDDSDRSGVKVRGHETAAGNSQQSNVDDFDYDWLRDSSSSQGDSVSVTADDEKIEIRSGGFRKMLKKGLSEVTSRASRTKGDHERNKSGVRRSNSATLKKPLNSDDFRVAAQGVSYDSNTKVYPSLDEDVFEDASNEENGTQSDDETVATDDNEKEKESLVLKQKLEIMENRIEKLEEELQEVAALEIALYSIIPEHGSSSHKVHTPARRLSRLYMHVCKHWTRNKSAKIAKNTVSGLMLITRTCGNDVTRLTFWLSNTVTLREIISQAFGISCQTSSESVGNALSLKSQGHSGSKQVKKTNQLFEDWEETSTFTSALEKIESWIFSRVVESVWWQALTPNMNISKSSDAALSDPKQGIFSIKLWIDAFQTAFQKLCPVRAAGSECGCLPVFSKMVIEQCLARLDVAMFNAILRESSSHIPTDPVSDPMVDSRVLPIPAGEFNFGSGALLKNAVGNWCRWFEDTVKDDRRLKNQDSEDDDDHRDVKDRPNSFRLLNELSDLLMLPKDLLMDKSVRDEVCPSISVDVIKRILCYFTPDEFCADLVPEEVLEALNDESFVERRFAGESSRSFPYAAGPVIYFPPSARDVSEKVGAEGEKPRLDRNVSMVQNKGYTSDEELDGLDFPLTSLIEPASPCAALVSGKSSLKNKEPTAYGGNVRYELLREVWSL